VDGRPGREQTRPTGTGEQNGETEHDELMKPDLGVAFEARS